MEMNRGVRLAIAMWILTGLSVILVVLRLYTRICIVKFVGVEDHLYAWTGLCLILFTIFLQTSVNTGLGQDFWALSVATSSDAIFWTYVANSFAIIGNALAKLSMGLFLLRVVQVRWHKMALWTLCFVTATTSAVLVVMLWNQSEPRKASWDPIRTKGVWVFHIQPLSVGLGVWSSICDFFFAIFPWLFIMELKMPQREKIMLAGGMSLGVIAGACGITRTIVLSRLDVYNYTLNFPPYFAWAGAEIAVSIACIGIPTLRPLYVKVRGKKPNSQYARQHSNPRSNAKSPPSWSRQGNYNNNNNNNNNNVPKAGSAVGVGAAETEKRPGGSSSSSEGELEMKGLAGSVSVSVKSPLLSPTSVTELISPVQSPSVNGPLSPVRVHTPTRPPGVYTRQIDRMGSERGYEADDMVVQHEPSGWMDGNRDLEGGGNLHLGRARLDERDARLTWAERRRREEEGGWPLRGGGGF